jgi:hypothetical protein
VSTLAIVASIAVSSVAMVVFAAIAAFDATILSRSEKSDAKEEPCQDEEDE